MERERNSNFGRHIINIHSCIERSWELNHSHGDGDQFQWIDTRNKRILWSSHVRSSGEHDSPDHFRHATSRGHAHCIDWNMDQQSNLL